MTLDNSLINDTFMYPYTMDYNTPSLTTMTPVTYYMNNNNNNNNNKMVRRVKVKKINIKN